MESKPQRDENGQLLPGNTANPNGLNGHTVGYQRYGVRCRHFLEKYTIEELHELATNRESFNKLSTRDGIIVRHIVNTLAGTDMGPERDRLLNRIEGKPQETIVLEGGDPSKPIRQKFTLEFGGATDDDSKLSETETL